MKILISGKPAEAEDGITILQLMEREQVETPQYVTVAVNNAFIPMDRYACYALQEGDAVEFLYYTGGGCDGAEQ
ncbi:MAG: sulfur carrier protein ThiS [Oscillospiraceae bacterium]|nr:sulfur carrier protein ThiS [Oscillospiraceae bacterium]